VNVGAAELVALYRAKDKVEKGFQTIKSVLAIRPLRHRTDNKVAAHVTLCVLALAVERMLERRLRNAGRPMTAPRALAELADVQLHELAHAGSRESTWTVTKAPPTAKAIAEALDISWALDPEDVAARLNLA